MSGRPSSRREFLAVSGAFTTLSITDWFNGNDLADRVSIADPNDSSMVATITKQFRQKHPTVSVSVVDSGLKRFGDVADIQFASRPPTENESASESDEQIYLGSVPDAVALHTSGHKWCRCLDANQRVELLTSASVVETWSEADLTDTNTVETIEEVVPSAGTTVLARGVRRHQYAIGHGGVGYYETNPANVKPLRMANADSSAIPLVRLRFAYADRASLAQPAVRAFAQSAAETTRTLTNGLDYVQIPTQAARTSYT